MLTDDDFVNDRASLAGLLKDIDRRTLAFGVARAGEAVNEEDTGAAVFAVAAAAFSRRLFGRSNESARGQRLPRLFALALLCCATVNET